jgi:hypothetical protein
MRTSTFFILLLSLPLETLANAQGKIKGSGGVSSISGAGGGGLIPWATLSSHASRGENGASGFTTHIDLNDFRLNISGLAINIDDRIELSYARQNFIIKANDAKISQDIFGLKLKLAGDLLYESVPLISIGTEHNALRDPATARTLGATDINGTDVYLSAARAWIDGFAGRTSLLNLNLRYSTSNQYGLLGYGGDAVGRRIRVEAAAAVFLTRSWLLGTEYRQKADNLTAVREQSARDVFVAWIPSKNFSITGAWVQLGNIAGADNQRGYYLSLQGNF